MKIRIFLLISVSLIAGCSRQREEDIAMEQIRPEGIKAHMQFLADDLLEGRGTGTRGYEIASKYVAAQFQGLGFEPAGIDGSFYQPVSLRRLQLVSEQSSVTLTLDSKQQTLVFGKDFLLPGSKGRTEASVHG